MAKLTPELIANKRGRAVELLGKGDSTRAVAVLADLAAKGLTDPVFLTELADAHIAEGDHAAAAAALSRLLRIYPGSVEAHRLAGDRFFRIRRPEEALRVYLAPSPVDDASGECRVAAAEILERLGRKDEARALVAEVLRADPTSEPARLADAMLHPKNGDKIAALSDLLAGDTRDRTTRWRAGHALASALDAAGDYPGAFRALAATKARMEEDFAAEIPALRQANADRCAAIRRLSDALTPKLLLRWRAEADALPPVRVAMLAGHPRSGTTLLESILDAHSGLVSVEESGCMEHSVRRTVFKGAPSHDIFDAGFLDRLPSATLSKARAEYSRMMAAFPATPPGDRLLLDKNPILTHFLGASARFFPSMKLIVALRDPRDVCLSCHRQPVGVNATNVPWLRLEDTMSFYNEVMGVWIRLRDMLPAEDFLEVRYETLVEDTPGVVGTAFDFLGLPRETGALDYHRPENRRAIFSPTYAQAARPVYKNARRHWENYAEYLDPHLHRLAPAVAALGYS